jgi:hypothetical protein
MKDRIEETVTRDVARVEVNDDYRVTVWQRRKTMDYTPDEATAFARLLAEAAVESQAMMRLHLAEAAVRTQAGVLGSDLVPDGTSGRPEPETAADGRTATSGIPEEARRFREGTVWPNGGYPEGTQITASFVGGWPAECSCVTLPGALWQRSVVRSCYLHGRGPIRGFGEAL